MTADATARGHGAGRPVFPVGSDAGVPGFPVRRTPGAGTGGDVRTEARRAIEAVLMAATDPVPARDLAELVECGVDLVAALCRELADEYAAEGRGFVLVEVAGGYRYQTHPDLAAYVEQFVLEGQHVRLSAPALETLAIVAYKQPITRGQVSAIRGVNVESTLQTLVQKGYVQEMGRDPGPGLASLYGTTPHFLERLGLASLADLPAIGDFVPGPEVVEALERGLRADRDPRLAADDPAETADDGTDDPAAADAAAEPGDDAAADPGTDAPEG